MRTTQIRKHACGCLPILVQLLFRHAYSTELVLQQANFALLTVERAAKVTCEQAYLICITKKKGLSARQATHLMDRVSSACDLQDSCCSASFCLSKGESKQKWNVWLIRNVKEIFYLLISLFKCKNAKLPSMSVARRISQHTNTHAHSQDIFSFASIYI